MKTFLIFLFLFFVFVDGQVFTHDKKFVYNVQYHQNELNIYLKIFIPLDGFYVIQPGLLKMIREYGCIRLDIINISSLKLLHFQISEKKVQPVTNTVRLLLSDQGLVHGMGKK